MNIYRKLKATLVLREAIAQANELFAKTGERQYVVATSDKQPKLIIMDRKNFRKLKQKRYITHKAFIRDLEVESFYHTPYRNGSGELPPHIEKTKRRYYYKWYDAKCKSKSRLGKVFAKIGGMVKSAFKAIYSKITLLAKALNKVVSLLLNKQKDNRQE